MIDGPKRGFMQFQDVRGFLDSVLSEDIHAKRVYSLANAALGVMTGTQGCSTLLTDGQAEQVIDPSESGPVAVLVDGIGLVGP
jgi:hypothetical protein